ncbi:MAG: thioredoxin fold domain-containing protein [Rubrivivax sp.]|nr:thioredoxin fold domain-containing protein [Pyrinomonadaceae bacterium]
MAANVAIIIVTILLCMVLVKNHFTDSPTVNLQDTQRNFDGGTQSGKKINLPEVDWQNNGQTLLLALSTSCHFCTESAAFYRRLKQESGNTHLVAIFPQPSSEGEDYLKKLAVSVDEVRQAPFESLDVRGTPTLIFVDGNGEVKDSWIGKLPANQETQVLNRLQQKQGLKTSP